MLAKNHILAIVLISICAVLAVTFGCVFGMNSSSPKTDLNTNVEAATYTSGKFIYTYTAGSGVCTVSRNGTPSGTLTIPSSVTISGSVYTVTEIAEDAFYSCSNITSVTIPETIVKINGDAFWYCTSLATVVINSTQIDYIGSNAFYNTPWLTDLKTNSNGVATASDGSTKYMIQAPSTLYSVSLSGVRTIAYAAYSDCTSLSSSVTIPSSVINIGDYAFNYCSSITTLTIGDGVKSIGTYAFRYCTKLKTVKIGRNVTSIGNYAFSECEAVATLYLYNLHNWCTLINGINRPSYGCYNVITLYINNTKATSVVIPSTVTSIGAYVFYMCTNITSVTIPDSVTSIGAYAFYYLTAMTSLSIGSGVTSIGTYAFNYAITLNSLYYNAANLADFESKNYVFDRAGTSATSLTVTVGSKVTQIPEYLFYHYNADTSKYTKITSLVFEDNGICTTISKYSFSYCYGLRSVMIPSSVTTIEDGAFNNCTAITNLYIDDAADWSKVTLTSNPLTCSSVTAINLYIDNVLATDVVISSKTTLINNYAFYKCANITSVTIADTVTSIGQYAFRNCTALKEVTIGSGVTSIGQYAFNSCTALTSVFFMQLANFSVGSSAFISNSSLVAYYFVSQDILNTIKTNYNTESITGYFTNTNFYLCCVVSFESSGGSECPKMGFVSGSSYGSLPTPTREGYRFAGWYTNSALTGSAVSTSTTASASHTLYAKWTFDGIDVVVSGASTSLSSSSVEMDEYNATVIVKPKAGYYISEFSFDNSVFIPVECYTTSIRDIPFAWSVTYYASKANNRLIFSFEYVDLDCLENGQLATIYLKTTTTPYASLKETTGAISISGVAVSATLGGSVTLIGDAYESLADSDTITCVAKVCVPGYEFDGWYSADDMGTCLSDADSKRFTKTEIYEKQIIAVFKPIENTSVNDNVSN